LSDLSTFVRPGVLLVLLAASASGASDLGPRVGARAGISAPSALELDAGPMAGLDLGLRLHPLWALEAGLERSWHRPDVLTLGWLGLQYRLDATALLPYLTLAVEGSTRRDGEGRQALELGGALGLGVLVPLGQTWFWGGEARYGVGVDGAFPTRQAFFLRLGYAPRGP
jgi:hypothetical protein